MHFYSNSVFSSIVLSRTNGNLNNFNSNWDQIRRQKKNVKCIYFSSFEFIRLRSAPNTLRRLTKWCSMGANGEECVTRARTFNEIMMPWQIQSMLRNAVVMDLMIKCVLNVSFCFFSRQFPCKYRSESTILITKRNRRMRTWNSFRCIEFRSIEWRSGWNMFGSKQ